jgi:hypothetical protein
MRFLDLVDLGKSAIFPYTLLETFPIHLPDGREWSGSLWITPTRRNGRRIQVRDDRGNGLFDSNDCFAQSNARNTLELWLQEQIEAPSRMVRQGFEAAA